MLVITINTENIKQALKNVFRFLIESILLVFGFAFGCGWMVLALFGLV